MRIAIVDDDPIVCQSLETILTATGTAEVLWMANDGDAAVRRYFETPASRPDVLLIDIQMPEIYTLSLHDALPISAPAVWMPRARFWPRTRPRAYCS